ncbi:4155_t:CDS:2 [Paraglomus occultum]|uniref:4155_t:CDS:1 n=1 Tax=Paraglomus occultum TaxID=144539 RepID=A0A9N9BP33_9GLOM|nr:4155_t:CDS:2 [Paraglomus occultum]
MSSCFRADICTDTVQTPTSTITFTSETSSSIPGEGGIPTTTIINHTITTQQTSTPTSTTPYSTSTSTFEDDRVPLIVAFSILTTLLLIVLLITYIQSRRQSNGQELQSSISATESAMSQLSSPTMIASGWSGAESVRIGERMSSHRNEAIRNTIIGSGVREYATDLEIGTMTTSNAQMGTTRAAVDSTMDATMGTISATSYTRSLVTTDIDDTSFYVTPGASSPTIINSPTTLPPLSNNSMTISRSASISFQRALPKVSMLQIEPMTRRLTVNLGQQGRSIVVRDTDAGGTDHVVNVVSLRPETPTRSGIPGLKRKLLFWKGKATT